MEPDTVEGRKTMHVKSRDIFKLPSCLRFKQKVHCSEMATAGGETVTVDITINCNCTIYKCDRYARISERLSKTVPFVQCDSVAFGNCGGKHRAPFPYLGTVVGGRKGCRKWAGRGDSDIPCRGGKHFLPQEEGRVL